MKKKTFLLCIAIVFSILVISCSKEDEPSNPDFNSDYNWIKADMSGAVNLSYKATSEFDIDGHTPVYLSDLDNGNKRINSFLLNANYGTIYFNIYSLGKDTTIDLSSNTNITILNSNGDSTIYNIDLSKPYKIQILENSKKYYFDGTFEFTAKSTTSEETITIRNGTFHVEEGLVLYY